MPSRICAGPLPATSRTRPAFCSPRKRPAGAAVNLADSAGEVAQAVRRLRMATKEMFAIRLRQAAGEGQIPPDADIPALAGTLNALLEGLSLQARDGLSRQELSAMAALAVNLLPAGSSRR